MTPLRKRVIEDMELAGLAKGTRRTYVDAVGGLGHFPTDGRDDGERGSTTSQKTPGERCGCAISKYSQSRGNHLVDYGPPARHARSSTGNGNCDCRATPASRAKKTLATVLLLK